MATHLAPPVPARAIGSPGESHRGQRRGAGLLCASRQEGFSALCAAQPLHARSRAMDAARADAGRGEAGAPASLRDARKGASQRAPGPATLASLYCVSRGAGAARSAALLRAAACGAHATRAAAPARAIRRARRSVRSDAAACSWSPAGAPEADGLPAYGDGVVFFDLDDTLIDVNRRVRCAAEASRRAAAERPMLCFSAARGCGPSTSGFWAASRC